MFFCGGSRIDQTTEVYLFSALTFGLNSPNIPLIRRTTIRHELDYKPIPEKVIYVNELNFADRVPYTTTRDMERAVTGECEKEGGVLPNENVRIYVPIDLNADFIMWRLHAIFFH